MTSVPDIPQFIGGTEEYKDLYAAFKLRQRKLLAQQITLIENNIRKYANKRAARQTTSKVFKKVLKGAQFIPADASRYVSGFDLTKVEYFILHRPSNDPKASTLENIILTFAQYEAEKASRMRGYCPSTHFAIGQRGELIQFVDLEDRTFHVGVGSYNETSIGVEIEGAVGTPLSVACYTTLAKLALQLRILCPKLVLDAEHIIEHRKLEPQRKTDVGSPYLFETLKDYIDKLSSTVTTAEFEELSQEDVTKSLVDIITELSSFGNMLAGLGKLEHKRFIAALTAEARRQATVNVLRSGLTKDNLRWREEQKRRLLFVNSNRARTSGAPARPQPITNGAGVEL